MPFVKISSDLQLWYTSNTTTGDASKFNHSRPTILLFHPLFLDSTWLKAQFQDPRLSNNYNMIAFDARSSGRTKSKLTPYRDAWVDAADVGVAVDLLAIPRCHVFASQMNSVHAAYRFALLFPEKTQSLCLCQIPATIDFDWTVPAYFELLESWCFPQDLETVERACVELGYLMFNHGIIYPDLEDEVIAWWEMNFPATKRTRFLENALTCVSRTPLTDRMMQRIKCPVLVMHGDRYVVNPIEQAEAEAARIPKSQFFVVKGGPEAFTMVPTCATVVNRVYTTFLSRIPSTPLSPSTRTNTKPPVPYKPRKEKAVLSAALRQFADAVGDPSLAQRKPTSLSFSMSPAEKVRENAGYLSKFADGEGKALTALERNGLPVRKASARHEDEWTEAAFDRTSMRQSMSTIRM